MGRQAATFLAGAALATLALLTPTAAAYVFPPTPQAKTTMVERAAAWVPPTMDAVVLVSRPQGRGTAFHVGNGLLVTAAHVVDGAKTVSIKDTDGNIGMARVVKVDAVNDLAILSTEARLLSAEVDCSPASVGDEVMAIGNPMGQEFVSSFGRIAGAPREVGSRSVYVTDMTTVMGMSGGPVFHGGRVIGVTHAVMLAPLEAGAGQYVPTLVSFGYVIPSARVCDLLASVGEWEGV